MRCAEAEHQGKQVCLVQVQRYSVAVLDSLYDGVGRVGDADMLAVYRNVRHLSYGMNDSKALIV